MVPRFQLKAGTNLRYITAFFCIFLMSACGDNGAEPSSLPQNQKASEVAQGLEQMPSIDESYKELTIPEIEAEIQATKLRIATMKEAGASPKDVRLLLKQNIVLRKIKATKLDRKIDEVREKIREECEFGRSIGREISDYCAEY